MPDGVLGVVADIEYQPVAAVENPFSLGDRTGEGEHRTDDVGVAGSERRGVGDVPPGHDEDVRRRDRGAVAKGDDDIGLGEDLRRLRPADDPAEDAALLE